MATNGYIGGGPKGKKGFPDYDAKHARLAISGATRSEHAGNISSSEESRIKSAARAKLSSFHEHASPKGAALKGFHGHGLHHQVHTAHAE